MPERENLVETQFAGVMINELDTASAIVLQVAVDEETVINIPITIPTGFAMYIQQYVNEEMLRPEMVDSWVSTIAGFNIEVASSRIIITKLEDDVYYAEISLVQVVDDIATEVTLDCKTSVAVLFALAMQKRDKECKILMNKDIVEYHQAQIEAGEEEFRANMPDMFVGALETLFGEHTDPEKDDPEHPTDTEEKDE